MILCPYLTLRANLAMHSEVQVATTSVLTRLNSTKVHGATNPHTTAHVETTDASKSCVKALQKILKCTINPASQSM